jgi:hypothetical protein
MEFNLWHRIDGPAFTPRMHYSSSERVPSYYLFGRYLGRNAEEYKFTLSAINHIRSKICNLRR